VVTSLTQADIKHMRDQVFFEGPERNRRLSRYWLLLLLSAVIATAGVVSDSTATVIGAMIIAQLAAGSSGPLPGGGRDEQPASGPGHATAGRPGGRLGHRVGGLGRAGPARYLRQLPGVAIAISLVPPLAVAGLTLQSGSPDQCVGALLLFATNVAAILASGIVVMALYRVSRVSASADAAAFRRPVGVVIIVLLLAAVLVPLWINSDRVDKTTVRQADVQAVADQWASQAGWSVAGVVATGDRVLVDATGPKPGPDLAVLRQDLEAAGLAGLDVQVSLVAVSHQPLPK
jgi:uncharacterized membrane protein